MAQLIALVVTIFAALNMLNVIYGVLTATTTTVFQQIAERINIGLTALVLVVASGMFSIIGYLHRQELRDLNRAPLPTPVPEPVAAATSGRGRNLAQVAAVIAGILGFVGLLYVVTEKSGISGASTSRGSGAVLTWYCPGGVTHIGPSAPMAGCTSR